MDSHSYSLINVGLRSRSPTHRAANRKKSRQCADKQKHCMMNTAFFRIGVVGWIFIIGKLMHIHADALVAN